VVIVALIWRQILAIDGIVNIVLNTFGVKSIKWLLDYRISNWVLIFVNIWQWGGYNMVILFAGLESVDPQLIEAAYIDGARVPSIVRRVLTPLLAPTIAIAATLTALGGFKIFDLIYVLTRGGPAHSTEVVTTYIYWLSFGEFTVGKFSYSASLVVLFFLTVLFISLVRLQIIARQRQR
jgi:ABC-type sugar transport system permease subunit